MMATLYEIQALTESLLRIRGYGQWKVDWDSEPRRSGAVDFRRKVIFYSARLVFERTREGSLDTVYHEVAHVIAGEVHQHDEVWSKIARKLGGTGFSHWDPATRLTSVGGVY